METAKPAPPAHADASQPEQRPVSQTNPQQQLGQLPMTASLQFTEVEATTHEIPLAITAIPS